MQTKLFAEIVVTLYTFRMVVGPAAAGFMLGTLYLQMVPHANPNLAFMIMAAGMGFGVYKLLFAEDSTHPRS